MKNNTGHGVLPDYTVLPGLTDLQQHRDAVKTFALGLIGKSQH